MPQQDSRNHVVRKKQLPRRYLPEELAHLKNFPIYGRLMRLWASYQQTVQLLFKFMSTTGYQNAGKMRISNWSILYKAYAVRLKVKALITKRGDVARSSQFPDWDQRENRIDETAHLADRELCPWLPPSERSSPFFYNTDTAIYRSSNQQQRILQTGKQVQQITKKF